MGNRESCLTQQMALVGRYPQGNTFAPVFNGRPEPRSTATPKILSLIFTNQDGWQAMAHMKNELLLRELGFGRSRDRWDPESFRPYLSIARAYVS